MGGWSVEREVSLKTGALYARHALREAGYEVTEIDVDRDIAQRLGEAKAGHCLQRPARQVRRRRDDPGRCWKCCGMPYTHSGVLASALAMDKHQSKIMFKAAGIPVTDHVLVDRADIARQHVMPPPYVVKPVAEGSSYGVFWSRQGQEHPPQEILREDWTGGEELMVERFIPGPRADLRVMGDVALGVTEIVTDLASTITRPNTPKAAQSTSSCRNFTENLRRSTENEP